MILKLLVISDYLQGHQKYDPYKCDNLSAFLARNSLIVKRVQPLNKAQVSGSFYICSAHLSMDIFDHECLKIKNGVKK